MKQKNIRSYVIWTGTLNYDKIVAMTGQNRNKSESQSVFRLSEVVRYLRSIAESFNSVKIIILINRKAVFFNVDV